MSKNTLALCLAKGSQPNKEDFAKIMFPVKQILGVALGIGLGHFQFTGIIAIIM
jgi:hypothetical protein